jgi:hypothetical protein
MLNLLQNKSNESGGLNMGLLLGVEMGWMVVQYVTSAFMLWIFIVVCYIAWVKGSIANFKVSYIYIS